MKKFPDQVIGDYSDEKKVQKYYELVKNNTENENGGVDANVFDYLKRVLPENLDGKTVADIGCGDGRWSEHLVSLGAKNVYGIDLSEDMSKKATNKLEVNDNMHVIRADMQELPLVDDSIDVGFSTFSLMYFKNLEAVIEEVNRVLKNDGTLYIATNIITVENDDLLQRLQGKSVPVDLGFDQKIRLENLVQPIEQYREAFQSVGLIVEIEKHFEPEGVEISNDYKHKDSLQLEKVLWVLKKRS